VRATVAYPLRRHFEADYATAPLSVLVDPEACAAMLGLDGAAPALSPDVAYIYRKQLEEADILVVNKIDRISGEARDALVATLSARHPAARVLAVSCLTGEGLDAWLDALLEGTPDSRAAMDVDYDRYAEGEALLGWYNATADLAREPEDAAAAVTALAAGLRDRLAAEGIPVAHLKCSLNDAAGKASAAVSVTSAAGPVEATCRPEGGASGRRLVVNLRAEGDPEALAGIVAAVAGEALPGQETLAARAFRPGRPNPTHRLQAP
jgi:hypothetical protein